MPPPPPPPPGPPGPPPPPMPSGGGRGGAAPKGGGAPDRGALLAAIRGGAALKKTVTNDRSAPIVGNENKSSSGPAGGRGSGSGSGGRPGGGLGGGGGGPMGLGGLFADGMPKLKPAGQRGVRGAGVNSSPSPPKDPSPTKEPSPPKSVDVNASLAEAIARRAARLGGEPASNGNAPAAATAPAFSYGGQAPKTPTQSIAPKPTFVKSPSPERRPAVSEPVSFPKDMSPPQLHEQKGRSGPPLPSKPPASTMGRPASQSQAKRPTNKPPPPPKNVMTKFGTMGSSKPRTPTSGQQQQLTRRQSLGAPDAAALSVTKPQAAPPPPPPPRNMSVPNNINTLHRNTGPAPPPPIASKKPPPPAKPPLPPNKTASRSTPHLATMTAAGGGSAMRSAFEARFSFHNINDLSVTYEPTQNKRYPSKNKKSHQRRAPAPPPVAAVS